MIWILPLCFVILLFLTGLICTRIALARRTPKQDVFAPKTYKGSIWEHYADMINKGVFWIRDQKPDTVTVQSNDGLTLCASFLAHPHARGTLINFHGYRSRGPSDFSCSAPFYYSLGFNLLVIDQRAHGRSDGNYIGFGALERYDCLKWIDYIANRFGEDHPIFLGGISMGASTVLMASGLGLPKQVKGVIADCGFTSPYEIIGEVIRHDYHLPPKPVLFLMDPWARLLAKYGLNSVSTTDAMKTNTTPTLFVHGKTDDFVPCYMTERTYEACTTPKKLMLVDNAGHGLSFVQEPDRYKQTLGQFLEDCLDGSVYTKEEYNKIDRT